MKKLSLLFPLLLFFAYTSLKAQEVDFNQFIKETQLSTSEGDDIALAWWIPVEFWELAMANDESMSEAQVEELIETLRPYTIFAVVDGKMGVFGGVTYTPEDSIRESIKAKDLKGKYYAPIDPEELSYDLQNLLAAFRPVLKNMIGQMGENMNFYVFDDEKSKKERYFDPYAEGFVQLDFSGKEYQWKTPVSSLLPPKQCPEDNELMNGAWTYCPWHGEELKKAK